MSCSLGRIRNLSFRVLTLTMILIIGIPAQADRLPPDPVEALQHALKASFDEANTVATLDELKQLDDLMTPAEERLKLLNRLRERYLTKKVEAIHTIGEMRRALALQEWPQGQIPEEGPERLLREALVDRFTAGLREALRTGTRAGRLAAMGLLAEMGPSIRVGTTPIARTFTADLAELTKNADAPGIRQAAARTLGQIFPDPDGAVPALRDLLSSHSVADRLAAATGLVKLVRTVAELASRTPGVTGMEAKPADVADAGRAVVPVAAADLNDANPEVRRLVLEAVEQAALGLFNQLPGSQARVSRSMEGLPRLGGVPEAQDDPRRALETRTALMPLVQTLSEHAPAVAKALRDPDPEVRLRARRTLDYMGGARVRLLQRPGADLGRPATGAADTDPFLEGLRKAIPNLAVGLTDPDPEARLDSISVLESLGSEAASAAPGLVKALSDANRFVRWSAARTLGKAAPVEAATAVPALAKLLWDEDLDLRLAAGLALERYGPAAKAAVPDLIRSLKRAAEVARRSVANDGEMQMRAMRTLEGIGTDAAPAIPALSERLTADDPRVRQTAAEVLGHFGPIAAPAEPALRKALGDDSAEVRKAASDALLSVLRK